MVRKSTLGQPSVANFDPSNFGRVSSASNQFLFKTEAHDKMSKQSPYSRATTNKTMDNASLRNFDPTQYHGGVQSNHSNMFQFNSKPFTRTTTDRKATLDDPAFKNFNAMHHLAAATDVADFGGSPPPVEETKDSGTTSQAPNFNGIPFPFNNDFNSLNILNQIIQNEDVKQNTNHSQFASKTSANEVTSPTSPPFGKPMFSGMELSYVVPNIGNPEASVKQLTTTAGTANTNFESKMMPINTLDGLQMGRKLERNYQAVYLTYPNEYSSNLKAIYIWNEQDKEYSEERVLDVENPQEMKPESVCFLLSKPAGYLIISCQNRIYCFSPPKTQETKVTIFKNYEIPDFISCPTLFMYYNNLLVIGGSTRDNEPAPHVFVYNLLTESQNHCMDIHLNYGRKTPLVFHDDTKIYIFGGGEEKSDPAFHKCEIIRIKDLLENRGDIKPELIAIKYVNAMITVETLSNAAVIPTIKGHLVVGRNRAKVLFIKVDERMLYIGYSKYKMKPTWLNGSLTYMKGGSLVYFVFRKKANEPKRKEMLLN